MNQLQVFNNEQFGQVRMLEESGTVLFCGADIAKALGYVNPRKALSDHCKGVTKRDTPTASGVQEMSFIPEGDVYRLIVRSNLPAAEQFERWVMDEVLPTIRKTGTYAKPITQAEVVASMAQVLVDVERASKAALQLAEATAHRVNVLADALCGDEWLRATNQHLNDMCERGFLNKVKVQAALYTKLEEAESCNLASRVSRKQRRMMAQGARKHDLRMVSKLDVIAEDARLRRRFVELLDELE